MRTAKIGPDLKLGMTKSSGTVQMKFECEFNQSNE